MRTSHRILQRIQFIKKNDKLCKVAFDISNVAHKDWKMPAGREIVYKARKKIGYSDSTASCDIFWSLMGLYQWMKENKIVK